MGWFVCDIDMSFICRQKDFPKRLPSYNNYGRLGILVIGKTLLFLVKMDLLCFSSSFQGFCEQALNQSTGQGFIVPTKMMAVQG
jgi:hypothetical protein